MCFLTFNFDKLTASELKPTLIGFYNDEELAKAKEILMKTVSKVLQDMDRANDVPRLPKRIGDNKGKQNADDLLRLFCIIDEQKLSSSLPVFAAVDLLRIPFLNQDSINLVSMARKMETFEQRLQDMEKCYIRQACESVELAVKPERGRMSVAGSRHNYNIESETCTGNNVQHVMELDPPADDRMSATDTDNAGTSWTEVTRRHRPVQPRRPDVEDQRRKDVNTQRKKSKLFGTAQDCNNAIKSGVEIVRKAVVHIDNLDANCTQALLTDYLLSKDISVLSCFETKSWLRDDERDKVTAFRVCVSADHRTKLMDGNLWSKGIILRDWKFKGKPAPQNGVQH